MKKFLEGCKKLEDGRYRIHESLIVMPKKELVNEQVLIEGKMTNVKSKYVFYIWNDEQNANGRNYKYVIDRVIKEGKSTITLTNHPEGDNVDMGKANGVAKNPRRMNGWMVVDWYPADCEDGRRFASIFDLDGPICVSSSVLGNLDDDGYVQNDDSFYLERFFDIVDSPSNRVLHYQTKTEILNDDFTVDKIAENDFNESRKNTSSVREQNDKTEEDKKYIGDKSMSDNDELLQTSLQMNVKSLVKDAEKIEDPFEKKEALLSADSFAQKLENPELHNEIEQKLSVIEDEIKTLSDKGKDFDSLNAKVSDLTKSKENLEDELACLKEEKAKIEKQLQTISTMFEEKQYLASENELERNHRLSKELCSIKAKNRNLESKVKQLENKTKIIENKAKRVNAESNTKIDVDVVLKYKERIEVLEKENNELVRENAILEKQATALNRRLGGATKSNDILEARLNGSVDIDDVVMLKKKVANLESKNARLINDLNESREEHNLTKSRFEQVKRNIERKERFASEKTEPIIENKVSVTEQEVGLSEDDKMEKMLNGDY